MSSSGSKCMTVSPRCGLPGDTPGSASGAAAAPVPQWCLPEAWFWRKASTPGPFRGLAGATRRRWLGPPVFCLMLPNCLQDSFFELPSPSVEQGGKSGKAFMWLLVSKCSSVIDSSAFSSPLWHLQIMRYLETGISSA